ncbi:MAG: glycoside hydrolase family 2 [Ignavibacteriae bacterium]|nr:glycoside hydrolase family 2 [Ignavibacteriota bacterium]
MNNILLQNNWKLISSEKIIAEKVENISSEKFDDSDWYVAKIPSTVLGTLVENGVYKNPYFGTNLKNISTEQFKIPWWYRSEFIMNDEQVNQTVLLHFDGINYKANVWLNGKLIADEKNIFGAFRRFQFNISENIKVGKNILAIEVIPPKPGDFTIGFVDWNPNPPDNNLGIFRDISIHFNKGVEIKNPFVESEIDLTNFRNAELIVSAELVNHLAKKINCELIGKIENIIFKKEINLEVGETKNVKLSVKEFPQLNLENPKIWWPNKLGEPNLYEIKLSAISNNEILDETSTKFGIRKIEDYINDGGHRGFKINGHKLLIRGAGWTDDLLLQDTHQTLETQIKYVKDMNLNCIRLEGFWGKDQKLYDLCDENGILIMVGWSCQWEHKEYLGKEVHPKYGGVIEKNEIELIAKSWEDQLLWLRNHPSIFVWTVGSDMLPHPDLEKKYIETFNKYDQTRPYLNSTGGVGSEQGIITSQEIISEISGSSRVKMLGPYAYTPPIYWYTNKNLGGAYGFNTETCPGANIPPIESLKKFIPQENLWPVDVVWNFHCGKNYFSHIDRTQIAIEKRYGKPKNVEDFVFKAQMLNYELMRPMFEAFQVNQKNATGIIQWMLNSAWPELYWQLYDSFLMPNGAYFGAKIANETIQLIYNYGDFEIYILNNSLSHLENFKAEIKIYNLKSEIIFEQNLQISIDAESSKSILKIHNNLELTTVYFVDLRIFDNQNNQISNNFYWLSKKEDILDYEAKVEGWNYYTPSKQYANFSEIDLLPKVSVNISQEIISGNNIKIKIENNNDVIAFFIELLLFDKYLNEVILPVLWSDNYISLLPNEIRIIEAEISDKIDLHNSEIRIKGWNLK